MKAAGAFNGLPRELRCLKFTPHDAGDAAVRFYSLNKFAIKPCVCSVFGQLVSPQEHASARHSTTVLSPKGWVCSGRARRLNKATRLECPRVPDRCPSQFGISSGGINSGGKPIPRRAPSDRPFSDSEQRQTAIVARQLNYSERNGAAYIRPAPSPRRVPTS